MLEVMHEQSKRPNVETFSHNGKTGISQVLSRYDNGHKLREIQFAVSGLDDLAERAVVVCQFGMDADAPSHTRQAKFEETVDFALDAMGQSPTDPASRELYAFVNLKNVVIQAKMAQIMTATARGE
jgi:hypothetical protein